MLQGVEPLQRTQECTYRNRHNLPRLLPSSVPTILLAISLLSIPHLYPPARVLASLASLSGFLFPLYPPACLSLFISCPKLPFCHPLLSCPPTRFFHNLFPASFLYFCTSQTPILHFHISFHASFLSTFTPLSYPLARPFHIFLFVLLASSPPPSSPMKPLTLFSKHIFPPPCLSPSLRPPPFLSLPPSSSSELRSVPSCPRRAYRKHRQVDSGNTLCVPAVRD